MWRITRLLEYGCFYMCVCVYVCMYVCMYVLPEHRKVNDDKTVWVRVLLHTHMCVCMHECMYVLPEHPNVKDDKAVRVRVLFQSLHTQMFMYVDVDTDMYNQYTYIHTYTHIFARNSSTELSLWTHNYPSSVCGYVKALYMHISVHTYMHLQGDQVRVSLSSHTNICIRVSG